MTSQSDGTRAANRFNMNERDGRMDNMLVTERKRDQSHDNCMWVRRTLAKRDPEFAQKLKLLQLTIETEMENVCQKKKMKNWV